MKLLKLLVVLISIFSVSVYFRMPYVEKDVSTTYVTSATTLTVLENWKSQGISYYYYTPVLTWQNEGDKFITDYKRLEDKRGNNYYISYPPFAFLFPYAIFSLLNIEISQVPIQILNIILHFISAFFIYLIICKYCKCNYLKLFPPAIVGFISYTFIPVLLFIHTFDFFSEMLGQVFFIVGIYLYQLLEENKESINKKYLILFGLNLFILIYTEWIGVFFAFTLFLISLKKFKREIFYRKLLKTVVLYSILAIILIVFQYSCINGMANLLRSSSLRFLERSGLFGNQYSDLGISYINIDSYKLLFIQLHQTLLGFGYIALILFIIWLIKKKPPMKQIFINKISIIIFLPIILEFFLFFNATIIHFICWAKFGIPLSIGIALLFGKLNFKHNVFYKAYLPIILTIGAVVFSIFIFEKFSTDISQKKDWIKKISIIIKNNSKNDEAVFIKTPKEMIQYYTYLSYMSKRNIENISCYEEVNKILKEKQKVKGVIYTFEPQNCHYSIQHIELN